jgi:NitT/TauT family transport system substrate-binding protein
MGSVDSLRERRKERIGGRNGGDHASMVGIGHVAAVYLSPSMDSPGGRQVSVSALTFVSSAPLFIAQDRGHFKEGRLEVGIKFFTAARPVAVAVTSGGAGFSTTG